MFADIPRDSFVMTLVLATIALVLVVNIALVLFACGRRLVRLLTWRYVLSRERQFTDTVFGTLIEPPDRATFHASRNRGNRRRIRPGTFVFPDRSVRPRPWDRRILEGMFLQLAVEVRGSERDTITAICEDAGFVDRNLRDLHSRRWWIRLRAARRLGMMHSTAATPALLRTLDDPNREVSLAAMRALGDIGDPKSYDRLLAAMEDETRWDSVLVAEVVLQLGPRISAPIIAHLDATDDRALQAGYARLLGLLREPSAVGSLLPLLDVDDMPLRLEVVRALGSIGDSRVAPLLLPRLGDEQTAIRGAAAEALGQSGDAGVVEPLRGRLEDADRSVRYRAAVALAALGRTGHAALAEASEDDDPTVHLIANQILAEAGMGLR